MFVGVFGRSPSRVFFCFAPHLCWDQNMLLSPCDSSRLCPLCYFLLFIAQKPLFTLEENCSVVYFHHGETFPLFCFAFMLITCASVLTCLSLIFYLFFIFFSCMVLVAQIAMSQKVIVECPAKQLREGSSCPVVGRIVQLVRAEFTEADKIQKKFKVTPEFGATHKRTILEEFEPSGCADVVNLSSIKRVSSKWIERETLNHEKITTLKKRQREENKMKQEATATWAIAREEVSAKVVRRQTNEKLEQKSRMETANVLKGKLAECSNILDGDKDEMRRDPVLTFAKRFNLHPNPHCHSSGIATSKTPEALADKKWSSCFFLLAIVSSDSVEVG